MRKSVLAAFAALPVASALAQGSNNPVDLSAAGTAATNVATSLSSLLTGDVMTAILTVVGAGLAIWAVFLIVRYVRRGAK